MEQTPEENEEKPFKNHRLNTPSLKRIALVNDGTTILKQEITESFLRVKAAKHGARLREIMPAHERDFYLPEMHARTQPLNKGDLSGIYASAGRSVVHGDPHKDSACNSLHSTQVLKAQKSRHYSGLANAQ